MTKEDADHFSQQLNDVSAILTKLVQKSLDKEEYMLCREMLNILQDVIDSRNQLTQRF